MSDEEIPSSQHDQLAMAIAQGKSMEPRVARVKAGFGPRAADLTISAS
jgi:hypothetical protein